MKKLCLALFLILAMAMPAHAAKPTGPCRGMSVRGTIACATERWSVPGGLWRALEIAERESRYRPFVVSPDGRYYGVYQIDKDHMPTWPNSVMVGKWWGRWFPHLNRSDPNMLLNHRFNILLAIRVVHFGGWGPWS